MPVGVHWKTSLGTSFNNTNSVTFRCGFAGLAFANSASAGMSTLPLCNWTNNDVQKTRICRVFPLSDSVHTGLSVVGEQPILVLLGNLYNCNEKLPRAALKGSRVPGILKGSMTIQMFCLCETLKIQNVQKLQIFYK